MKRQVASCDACGCDTTAGISVPLRNGDADLCSGCGDSNLARVLIARNKAMEPKPTQMDLARRQMAGWQAG